MRKSKRKRVSARRRLVDWCLLAPGTVYIRSMVPLCAIALLKLPSSINLTYHLTVINIRSIDTNRRVPIVHSINGCLLSIAPLLTQGPIASRLHLTNTVPYRTRTRTPCTNCAGRLSSVASRGFAVVPWTPPRQKLSRRIDQRTQGEVIL